MDIAGVCKNAKKNKYYISYIPYLRKIKVYIHSRVIMSPNKRSVVSAQGGGGGKGEVS